MRRSSGTQTSGHTDRSDWEGLHATGTQNPSGVPGLQIDGYFDRRWRRGRRVRAL